MQCQIFFHKPCGVFIGVISKYVVSSGETARVKRIVAAGDTSNSGRDPLKKTATHSTTVPLYCGSAGMVRVYTMVPSSFTDSDLMSGNRPAGEPFTLQLMKASNDV